MTAAPLVVVGSGLAGYAVAREFRKLDKETRLVVLSRDHGGYYSKPMLSNALAGQKTAASLLMKPAEKMAAELNADVRAGVSVQHIDSAARQLTLAGGEVLAYRDLVLALGADPIRVPLAGDAADAVCSVNDLDDYARFSQALEGAHSVAILGAGLIGCEFANDLLHRGIAPTVLDLADGPLSRLLPREASDWLRARLESAGVAFRFGAAASRVDHHGDGLTVTLADGSALHADRVLSAVGLQPRLAMAQSAGIAVGRGISVDRLLATSAAHVWAVGDCAEVLGASACYLHVKNLSVLRRGIFTPNAFVKSWGCNMADGEDSMYRAWKNVTGHNMIAADGKTDFTAIKDGVTLPTVNGRGWKQ